MTDDSRDTTHAKMFIAAAFVMACFSFHTALTCVLPIPKKLNTLNEKVAVVAATSAFRVGVNGVRFYLAGDKHEFIYKRPMPYALDLLDRMQIDSQVELQYDDAEQPNIWALEMDGVTYTTPEITHQTQRDKRTRMLNLGIVSLVVSVGLYFFKIRGWPKRIEAT